MKRSRSIALLSAVAGILLFGSCGGNGNKAKFPPTPTLSGLFPSVITAGSDGFSMAVTGTGFVSDSTGVTFVNWNGSPRSTRFNASTGQLSVQIFASDVASTTTANVTATNPGAGGTSLNSLPFTIFPPQAGLTITSLDPASAAAGSAAFMLTVSGTGFQTGDIINWNGSVLITTVMPMQSQATAQVSKALIASPGTASVSVSRPDQTVATKAVTFAITGPDNPSPSISSLSPPSATAGGPDFQMRIQGSGFAPSSFVEFNGTFCATAFLSSSQIVALVPAALISSNGGSKLNVDVTVTNPPPGGGASAPATFSIQ